MAVRRAAGQASLFAADDAPAGPVERAAMRDLRDLRDLGLLGVAATALQAAYRAAAREVDRARRAGDTWAATAAIRELRTTRVELAPMAAPVDHAQVDGLLDRLIERLDAERERPAVENVA